MSSTACFAAATFRSKQRLWMSRTTRPVVTGAVHHHPSSSRSFSSSTNNNKSSSFYQALYASALALTATGSVAFSWGFDTRTTAATTSQTSTTTSNVSFRPSRRVKEKYVPAVKKPYDISVRAIRGGRFTMEDEYFVANGGRFAAIFDGHGGSGVSNYLKKHLYTRVLYALQDKLWESDQEEPTLSTHVSALRAGFEAIEAEVIADDNLEFQGSTAVAVQMYESEDGRRTLLSANVGDSRAILSRKGVAVDLTRDQKPNDEIEKKRIMAMGETIEWDQECKVHRVRNLSLARAIGDRYAKPAVSAEVEIKHFPVDEEQDEFIVLASDGLWDVMSSQDVVTYVHELMRTELARLSKDSADNYKFVLRRNMAKFLAREAIRKGSADNISVLVVWL